MYHRTVALPTLNLQWSHWVFTQTSRHFDRRAAQATLCCLWLEKGPSPSRSGRTSTWKPCFFKLMDNLSIYFAPKNKYKWWNQNSKFHRWADEQKHISGLQCLATGQNYGSIHSHDMPGSKRGWDEATLFCGWHKEKRSERYVDLSGVDLVGVEGLITKKTSRKIA